MFIRSISVKNFKTLNFDNFQFKDYNIIIGPNGAGKSNLVSFFKFIANIMDDDLDTAIARQGGISSVLNFNSEENFLKFEIEFVRKYNRFDKIKESQPLRIKYCVELEFEKKSPNSVKEKIIIEHISLQSNKLNSEDKVNSEEITSSIIEKIHSLLYNKMNMDYKKIEENNYSFEIYKIEINRSNDKLDIKSNYPDIKNKQKNDINTFIGLLNSLFERKIYKYTNLILTDYHKSIIDDLTKIKTYDFDTKGPKNPSSQKSEKYLVESGENLVNRLESIFFDEIKKKRFLRMYKSFLPYIKDAEIRRTTSNSYSLYINESYNKKFTPPDLISDGTIGIIAIITALYFEELNIAIIEEPEKYIHPEIVRKIAHSIEDVSIYKQIIVTTHSTELLKHSKKENVIFVSRSKDGYSNFMYPSTDNKVREFMKNDMQLEDLFINNFLGVI